MDIFPHFIPQFKKYYEKVNNHRMTKAPFLGLLGKSLMFHDCYGGEGGIRTLARVNPY